MNYERRSGKIRRVSRDRRMGTNPRDYKGPEKRAVFDRRKYNERRQKKYAAS